MPVPIANGDLFRATMVVGLGAQAALPAVTYQAFSASGLPPVTDSAFATKLDTLLGAAIRAQITDNAAYAGFMVQRIFPLPKPVAVAGTANAGPGSAGSFPLPGEVCGMITSRTNLAGNAFRGRFYWPFLDASQLDTDGQSLIIGAQTSIQAIAAVMFSPITVTVGPASVIMAPVVFHRAANKHGTTAANTGTLIVFSTTRRYTSVQRRRGPTGRPNTPPI